MQPHFCDSLQFVEKPRIYAAFPSHHSTTHIYIFLISWDGVRLSPLGMSATIWPTVAAQMIDDDECGAVGGMRTGRGNRSTRRKLATLPLFPPQMPHDLTWDRTQTAAVGSRRVTA
jgi:hypothetical protein